MAQVSSYDVANRSGAQVRSDINDIFAAIKSCNSGASDPASPVKFMLFGDSTTGDDNLKVHDGSNFRNIGKVTEDNLGLLPRSGGTMTGPLLIDDANDPTTLDSKTPALSFDTDPDLGLFRKAANQMGFASGGTEQLFMDGNGITLNNQKSLRFSEPTSAATGGSVQYVEMRAPATLAANLTLTLPSTAPVAGYALISTDTSGNLSWGLAGGGAVGGGTDEIFWENDQTITQDHTITPGHNAGSFGPITIQNNVTVTVGPGQTWTVV